jgi:hypothetical protein
MQKRVVDSKKKPVSEQRVSMPALPQVADAGSKSVRFCTESSRVVLPADPDKVNLMQSAMQWTYVVRSRQRWSAAPTSIDNQALAARDFLEKCGVDTEALKEIAFSGLVEISTDWSGNEEEGWAERILPWEYVIAGATRIQRNGLPLTVTRHLNRVDQILPVQSSIESMEGTQEPDGG